MKIKYLTKILTLITFFSLTTIVCVAQDAAPPQGGVDDETLKEANNPMSVKKSVNVHNYFIPSLHGIDNASADQLLFRYAQPIGKVIVRATLPVVTNSFDSIGAKSGLGDFSLFAIYPLYKKDGNQVGIGPSITIPTATGDEFGAGKWQADLSAFMFLANNKQFQTGGLITWQASFAGDKERANVNMLTAQAFFIWQLGKGTCLRSSGIWSFDLIDGNFNVPIGLGIGQVIKTERVVFNIFMEPQYSAISSGVGQPKFQVFVGFNTQF